MEHDDRIPGITFHLEQSELGGAGKDGAAGKVLLSATVTDIDMWEQILPQFEGLRIYDAEDFKTDMIELLQEDNKRVQDELETQKQYAESTREQLLQRVSFLEHQASRMEFEMKKKDAELEYLRELKRELDGLA